MKTEQKGPEKTTTKVKAKESVKKEREDLEHKVHVGPAAARTSSGSALRREAVKDRCSQRGRHGGQVRSRALAQPNGGHGCRDFHQKEMAKAKAKEKAAKRAAKAMEAKELAQSGGIIRAIRSSGISLTNTKSMGKGAKISGKMLDVHFKANSSLSALFCEAQ